VPDWGRSASGLFPPSRLSFAADRPLASVLEPKAISEEEFATGLYLDFAVHLNLAIADKVLGLAPGIGEAGGLDRLG
jgi:hypothetical protein